MILFRFYALKYLLCFDSEMEVLTDIESNSRDAIQMVSQNGLTIESDHSSIKDFTNSINRSNSINSVTLSNSDVEPNPIQDNSGNNEAKKARRRGSKKKKKPEELLQCTICGRQGLTSEFCASGRFCSQRCVGAHASKCRADTLAAAAAAGEIVEPRKRKRQRKDGGRKGGNKKKSISLDKVRII